MTLYTENEFDYKLDFDYEQVAIQVIDHALDLVECPYESEVNLTLVDEETIQSTNNEFRSIDSVTDVLSFPMINYDTPAHFDEDAILEQDGFHPESGELLLGDIVICIPRMKEQAEEYGHGELREFAFLVCHSTLHLCGYDHMTEEEAKVMEALQERVLNDLNITR